MNKKWLIAIGVLLGVTALGVAAYFAWQNRERIAEVVPEIIGGTIAPIEPKVEKLKVISSRRVNTYWISKVATSSKIFYFGEEGAIMEIDGEGMETASTINLHNVKNIAQSPSGELLFARLGDDGDAVVYNTVENITNKDLIGVAAIAWGREEGKLAMTIVGNDTGAIEPIITIRDIKDDKSPVSTIIQFGLQGFDLQWPQKDALFMTQEPSAEYVSDMWRVDLKTKKLTKFLSERGLMVQWSPLGDRALKFATTEGRNHKLAIIDDKGGELMALRFITMPDKCAMVTSTQMYCAIPRDQEALSRMTLPDEYLKRDAYFQDGIYQIDLTTNGIRAIFEDEEPKIDATNLTVLDDRILFINRYDRKLYSLNLQ